MNSDLESHPDPGIGWAEMPPGPELAVLLDSVDPALLDDDGLIELICARRRLSSAAQAGELAAVAEFARRRAGTGEAEFANSELSCALRITLALAGACLDLAVRLAVHRQATFRALAAGLIDYGKAKVLADELDGIDTCLAGRIEETLLPQAPVLTTAQLRGRIRRMIEKADPEAARKRKRDAVGERDLTRWKNREGTWTIALRHLHGTTAGRIQARIAARARALKTDGDTRPLHQIRADLATAILLGEYPNGYPSPTGTDGPGGPDSPDGTDDPDCADGPGDAGGTDDLDTPDGADSPDSGPVPAPAAEESREPGQPAVDEPLDDAAADTGQARPRFPQPPLDHNESTTPDDQAAQEPGPEGQDPYGQEPATETVTAIITRAMHTLTETIRSPDPAIRARLAADTITRALMAAKSRSCVHTKLAGGTTIHGRPTYRPPPGMRKHIQVRDQRCRFPTCNRRAQYCDEDHTTPYHRGGATCPCNLACLCRHHHRVKQNRQWHLIHPWPGILIWITPNGHWHLS